MKQRFEAIGTRWEIHILEPIQNTAWDRLFDKIQQRIEVFDKTYSRFRQDSLITRAAQNAGRHNMPSDGYTLFAFYERLYKATGGKVTPLIGRIMEASGYDASYSFEAKTLRRPPAWEKVLSYDRQSFALSAPALLDFGAAGKGYLVDSIGGLIEQAGIRSYLIDAGGDIRHRSAGSKAIKVGLEHPANVKEVIGVAQLKDQSLCASAGSKRQWGRFSHLIDPIKLQPSDKILASWVIAQDTMTADGLATALFFTEPVRLQKQFTFSYAILHKDMSFQHSKNFPAEIFTRQAA